MSTVHSIVLAEDDTALRELLVSALLAQGYATVGARDGVELLDLVGDATPDELPDAFITDLRMPRCSGLDVIRTLRARGVRTPVLAVTAFADPKTLRAALDAGADAVLDKPFTLRQLLATLEPLLQPVEP